MAKRKKKTSVRRRVKAKRRNPVSEKTAHKLRKAAPGVFQRMTDEEIKRAVRVKKKRARARVQRVRKNPSVSSQVQEAVARFTGFRGDMPKSVDRVRVKPPARVMLHVGECLGIMYRTERDGVVEDYLHRFRKKSRPTLAVSSDGKTLYLLGGAYRVTDHGIEDA